MKGENEFDFTNIFFLCFSNTAMMSNATVKIFLHFFVHWGIPKLPFKLYMINRILKEIYITNFASQIVKYLVYYNK